MHETELSLIERGLRNPRISTVAQIASALDVPPGLLVDAAYPPKRSNAEETVLRTPAIVDDARLAAGPTLPRPIEVACHGISAEVIRQLAAAPERMRELHWRDFEALVAELFRRDGFAVHQTPAVGDEGVDLFAARKTGLGTTLYVVECKQHSQPIPPRFVRELAWVIDRHRATGGMLATTSTFAPGAQREQRKLRFRMALTDFADLRRWLLGDRIL